MLQASAAECRRAAPAPDVVSLSLAEREQHRILLAKVRESARYQGPTGPLKRMPNRTVINSTTRVGLAAAQEVFGETDAVILQEAEHGRWLTVVYPRDDEAF